MVYLIHFHKKLKHAGHYIGFVEGSLVELFKRHRNGSGSALLRTLNKLDINYSLARLWPEGDRNFERKLKRRKNGADFCPLCNKNYKMNGNHRKL